MSPQKHFFSNILNYILSFVIIFNIINIVYASDIRSSATWNKRPKDVLGIGQPMYDIFYKINNKQIFDTYLKQLNVLNGSTQIISEQAIVDLSKELKAISKIPGGGVSNTLAGIASFNNKVDFLGVVGNDKFGILYKKYLKQSSIGDLIRTIPGSSGFVSILISPEGERTQLVSVGISKNIVANNINEDLLKNYKMILTESYLFHKDKKKNKYFFDLFKLAKKCNIVTAFSLSNHHIVANHHDEICNLLKITDIVFGDRQEIFSLAKSQDWLTTKQKLKKYDCIFVVTDGKNGSYVLHKGKEIHIPAEFTNNIIDTTGAGDQYMAGFIYGYLNNFSLKECGELATKTACSIIKQIGAKPNIPFAKLFKNKIYSKVLNK